MISVYFLAVLRNSTCMMPHLLCVTISLTTIYLQDPIHSNQGSESVDILCCLFGTDNKRRLQDKTSLFKQNRFYMHKTMST